MSKRSWIALGLAVGAAAMSGCVVVPTEPAYGYGYGYGYARPRVAPPVVVEVPAPPPRYYGGGWWSGRRWDHHR